MRGVQLFLTRQDAGAEQLRLDVQGSGRHGAIGAAERLLQPACSEQQPSGSQLSVEVLREQVGGANVFRKRVPEVAGPFVRLGQLQPRFTGPWILLDRVAVLDDRLAVFLPRR